MLTLIFKDVRALWGSATTTAADRKEVVRHLVERVSVAVQGETEWVDVTIQWARPAHIKLPSFPGNRHPDGLGSRRS